MHHYINAITNTKGDALVGYFVRCVDATSGVPAALYADSSLTPILSVSGVADAAQVDTDGNADFYIVTGTYHLDIYATDSTTFVRRIQNVPMSEDVLPPTVQNIGLFTGASLISIGSGTTIVQSTGYSTLDKGSAVYVYDAAVDSSYVVAHPRSSFVSANGLGFRLSHEQDITPEMFGAPVDGSADDYPAFNAAIGFLGTVGGIITVSRGTFKLNTQPTWTAPIAWNISPAATFTGAGTGTGKFPGTAVTYAFSDQLVGSTTTEIIRFGRTSNPVVGDGDISPLTLIYHNPLVVTGTIKTIKAYGGLYAGTLIVRRFTKSGTVFTQIGSDSTAFSLSTGTLNTFTVSIGVNDGEYLGVWLDASGAGPLTYSSTTSDEGGFYYHSGNQTSVDTTSGTTFTNTLRLELAFDIEHTVVSTQLADMGEELDALSVSVGSLLGDTAPDECEIALGGWTARPMFGESISVGYGATPAISVTQPYSNLTFAGGVKSTTGSDITSTAALIEDSKAETAAAADGNHGETPISSAANHAVRLAARNRGVQPSQFIIFGFTGGHGGTKIADISKGTTYYTRLIDQITAAQGLASAASKSFVVPAIDLLIGINDAFAGTVYATVLAQLLTLQSDLETDIQVITGQTSPVHLLVSQQSQYNSTNTGTTKALAAACRESGRMHLVCPQYLFERSDSTHFTNASEVRQGHYHGRAFDALIEGRPVPALWPVSATADGTALEIRFDVPVGPIVLDTTTIGAATDKGIKVVDGTGTLTLSSIAVSSDGKGITATLNRTLGTSPKCRIGLDYAVSGTFAATNGTATNIRDSSTDTHLTSGTTYQMYHWAVADELDIVKLAEAV